MRLAAHAAHPMPGSQPFPLCSPSNVTTIRLLRAPSLLEGSSACPSPPCHPRRRRLVTRAHDYLYIRIHNEQEEAAELALRLRARARPTITAATHPQRHSLRTTWEGCRQARPCTGYMHLVSAALVRQASSCLVFYSLPPALEHVRIC